LIETDAPVATDSDPGPGLGTGGSVQAACPPAQWDCSGLDVHCDDGPTDSGIRHATISVSNACRCDTSRPAAPSDCAAGELFVCGSLGFREAKGEDELSFEPVSCRCAVNAGYYCSHCAQTGLYAGSEVLGCRLDGVTTADSTPVHCGCPAIPH